MTIIKTVTELLPHSNEILEKSSIPFACTITPYAPLPSNDPNEKKLHLSSIAKCANCGSLLNPFSPMLDYPTSKSVHGTFLCGLCGVETTLHPDIQCELNLSNNDNDINISDAYYIKRYETILHEISNTNRENYSYFSRMTNVRNTAKLKEILPECYESSIEYTLDDDVPAQECPFLLIIVILYSSRYNSPSLFYKYICECIHQILQEAPRHVKLGIFIGCPNGRIIVMDLSSTIPHWKHVFVNDEDDDGCALKEIGLAYNQIFISLENDTYRNNVESVLRALGDSLVIHSTCTCNEDDTRVEMGTTLEAILDYIEYTGGYHPGSIQNGVWKYAGGKLFLFCHEAPKEIPASLETYGDVGLGGSAASCGIKKKNCKIEDRFAKMQRDNIICSLFEQEEELHGVFTAALMDTDSSLVEYFGGVGYRCCTMALGVDIFGLVNVNSEVELDKKVILGIPLLRIVSQRSGCGSSGPILVELPIHDYDTVMSTKIPPGLSLLLKEVSSRLPWKNTAMGAMLKLRTSQSFTILTDEHKAIGPCSVDPMDDTVWHFGTCDEYTTLSLDFEILGDGGIGSVAFTESHGDVELPTCIQSCFVYTAVVYRDEWVVVRRLRVNTMKFSIARDTESFIMSLNPEVMAMTLFHKLYSMSLTLGYKETQILAKDWLLSLLLSTYQSALTHFSLHNNNKMQTIFSPADRILHIPGSNFSPRDILLGAGTTLQNIPLIVYSLLVSDALYPLQNKNTYYYPTIDARCAAVCNMHSLPPHLFSKCVLPTISLHSITNTDNDEAVNVTCIIETLPCNKESIQMSINDQQRFCVDNNENLFLVVDCAKYILCCRYSFDDTNALEDTKSTALENTVPDDNPEDIMYHPAITQLLQEKAKQYKVPPCIHRIQSSSLFSDEWLDVFIEELELETNDATVNNNPYVQQQNDSLDFKRWCDLFAEMVHEEIKAAQLGV